MIRFFGNSVLLLSLVLGFTACDTERSALSHSVHCTSNEDCDAGFSCFLNTCIEDGTLEEGDTCTSEVQCGDGLICFGSVCMNGCRDIYHQDHCPDGYWCDPENHQFTEDPFGFRFYAGECTESECNPSSNSECGEGETCLQVTPGIGACIQSCQYGFNDGFYEDTCQPQDDLAHSCHVIGQTETAGCLPSGSTSGPAVGFAGCDTINRPCRPGLVCVNVVCRRLCSNEVQSEPCPVAESCVELSQDHDFSFCRAD